MAIPAYLWLKDDGVSPVMHDTKDPTKEKHTHLECVELRYEKKSHGNTAMVTCSSPMHGMRERKREIPNISGITSPAV